MQIIGFKKYKNKLGFVSFMYCILDFLLFEMKSYDRIKLLHFNKTIFVKIMQIT